MNRAITYKTISSSSRGDFRDRGSRFIAMAFPVTSEEEVKRHLSDLKKEYHDARHHCYAYCLGTDHFTIRAYDDGEPSGSAGKPILRQIQLRGLTNILVVVVRYFGGTLLGVGGLINAYKNAASSAIENARIVSRTVYDKFQIEFDYIHMEPVMAIIKEGGIRMVSKDFKLRCSALIEVPREKKDRVFNKFRRIQGLEIK